MEAEFEPPEDYRTFVRHKGGNIPPWFLLTDTERISMAATIIEQYPWHTNCLPFALTDERVAVFAKRGNEIIARVLRLASSKGREIDGEYDTFRDWLRAAVEDAVLMLTPTGGRYR